MFRGVNTGNGSVPCVAAVAEWKYWDEDKWLPADITASCEDVRDHGMDNMDRYLDKHHSKPSLVCCGLFKRQKIKAASYLIPSRRDHILPIGTTKSLPYPGPAEEAGMDYSEQFQWHHLHHPHQCECGIENPDGLPGVAKYRSF